MQSTPAGTVLKAISWRLLGIYIELSQLLRVSVVTVLFRVHTLHMYFRLLIHFFEFKSQEARLNEISALSSGNLFRSLTGAEPLSETVGDEATLHRATFTFLLKRIAVGLYHHRARMTANRFRKRTKSWGYVEYHFSRFHRLVGTLASALLLCMYVHTYQIYERAHIKKVILFYTSYKE